MCVLPVYTILCIVCIGTYLDVHFDTVTWSCVRLVFIIYTIFEKGFLGNVTVPKYTVYVYLYMYYNNNIILCKLICTRHIYTISYIYMHILS